MEKVNKQKHAKAGRQVEEKWREPGREGGGRGERKEAEERVSYQLL
jgi:hypothetical protein